MRNDGVTCARALVIASALAASPAWAVSSYPTSAVDAPGSSTGASQVALGVPDYRFVNDAALPFGGTSTSVFGVGESATFSFPTALRNVAGAPDLQLSAWVGGLGETDNAQVQVEVSSDGIAFHAVATLDTASGRTDYPLVEERDFASVKHFEVDFGAEDFVRHVRLTNLSGTAEGLRLDALEGLYPRVSQSAHAFEMRIERVREDSTGRFLLRLKNLSDTGGVAIREVRMIRSTSPESTLEETWRAMPGSHGLAGGLICVENCNHDNGELIPFSRHAWSIDGITEAPAGIGLAPGGVVASVRAESFDTDSLDNTYLAGFTFVVLFTDGYEHVFSYADVLGQAVAGQLYQKYLYFASTPAISGPRPTDYYEFSDISAVTFSNPASVGSGHTPGVGGRLAPASQNFSEAGLHAEAFWVRNNATSFVDEPANPAHFHDLPNGYETSHGFESEPGFGPDRQGIYVERVDGGAFDFVSLQYQLAGSLTSTRIFVSASYDPALPVEGQFVSIDVTAHAAFQTLEFSQFTNIHRVWVLADLSTDTLQQIKWDNFRFLLRGGVPYARAGADVAVKDLDASGTEVVHLDGSTSYDIGGTVVSHTWTRASDGVVLGTGPTVDVAFPLGITDVMLTAVDNEGHVGTDHVIVTVEPAQRAPAQVIAHQASEQTTDTTTHALRVNTLSIASGDLLVASMCADGGGGTTIACPAGWTQVRNATGGGGAVVGAVCYKQATAADVGAQQYNWTTSIIQQSQSGVIQLRGHDPLAPIEVSSQFADADRSPSSPALSPAPAGTSRVLRLMCADAGRVTEGAGFPAGMAQNLWLLESNDGGSGPVSGGGAIDQQAAAGGVDWTLALSENRPSINFSVAVTGGPAAPVGGTAPVAVAGADQTLTDADGNGAEVVSLDGSGSYDTDGSITAWRWSEGDVTLGTAATVSPSLPVGTHTLTLTVTDNSGSSASDALVVTVNPPVVTNNPPVANAGADITVTDTNGDGSESVNLNGAASSDSDGSIVGWSWREAGIPFASTASPAVLLGVGTHTLTLTVTDNGGASASDAVVVTVNAPVVSNQPPVANGGADITVTDSNGDGSETVALNGAASGDPDGSVVSWIWRDGASGPQIGSGSVVNATLAVGVHDVVLTVTDNGGATASDHVQVRVNAPVAAGLAYVAHETSEETTDKTVHSLGVHNLPIAAGDLMVAALCADGGNSTTIACPAGWTVIRSHPSTGDAVVGAACYKVAGAGDVGATTYTWSTSGPQQSQSGVILLRGQDPAAPIESSTVQRNENDPSPLSPALGTAPAATSMVLRTMCADGGRVTEGAGFPAGMNRNLWVLESVDGGSGPVSGGAAIDTAGARGSAEWTGVLSEARQSVNLSIAIRAGAGPVGQPPVASAGADITTTDNDGSGAESVTLDGSASTDPDGSIASWTWVEGGVTKANTATASISLAVGTHTLVLTVVDNSGNSSSDNVVVTVNPSPFVPVPPVANAGADITVADTNGDGVEAVALNGSASSDADGYIVNWAWTDGVGGASLGGGAQINANLAVGVHDVVLTVTDNGGYSASDHVQVTVSPAAASGVTYVAHETSEETIDKTAHSLGVHTLPLAVGDLMVAELCADGGNSTTVACPAGWTLIRSHPSTADGVVGAACFKQVTAADIGVTTYTWTTSGVQQSQSGVILLRGHDPLSPIEASTVQRNENDPSPQSPALAVTPSARSLVIRSMCADAGRVTEGAGFPAGMNRNLWMLESADGGSGPVSGGAAIDTSRSTAAAEWTNALSESRQSMNLSVVVRPAP